jgi:hypothetical protein
MQPVVDQREVGWLAPVAVERGDDLPAGVLDGAPDRQQFGRVGDEAGIVILPEVLALGPERGAVAWIVAAVLARIQEHDVGRSQPVTGRARPGDQQAIGLQARPMDPCGPAQQPQAQLCRHGDGIAGVVPAPRRYDRSRGLPVSVHALAEGRPASPIQPRCRRSARGRRQRTPVPVPPVFAEPTPTGTVNGKSTKSTGLKNTREALTHLP